MTTGRRIAVGAVAAGAAGLMVLATQVSGYGADAQPVTRPPISRVEVPAVAPAADPLAPQGYTELEAPADGGAARSVPLPSR